MTFDEWHSKVHKGFFGKLPQYEHLRFGQALMNELYKVKPDIYDSITGTDADIFYSSRNYELFIQLVSAQWEESK